MLSERGNRRITDLEARPYRLSGSAYDFGLMPGRSTIVFKVPPNDHDGFLIVPIHGIDSCKVRNQRMAKSPASPG
ncbi:hypothetical protein R1flu_003802 [Riccia fluitans]|uniref:Uncharacterized protein n=1 Tax=Riccia fluitans TaxID=41844 RepID=A0ABD1YDG7_9MARC